MKFYRSFLIFAISSVTTLFSSQTNPQTTQTQEIPTNNSIAIVGEMRNVMWKGQINGIIDIDTISNKNHLYGLGPIEYLTGEIMIIDGKSYKSVLIDDTTMKVSETFFIKAPLFAYANISSWIEIQFTDSISTIPRIENYLYQLTKKVQHLFFFKITAIADNAIVHIVNLPEGTQVTSPEDAHTGQKNFEIKNKPVELLGFFSTEHKAIFTHHDTYVHIHLITDDKQQMGHLEEINLKKGTAKLYIQNEN